MSFLTIVILSCALGITSFAVGSLPLTFSLSKYRIAQVATYGTGLLLGAALGVIIPEGIEAIYKSKTKKATPVVALTLLCGFTLMLIVEELVSPDHSHENEGYALARSGPSERDNRRASRDGTHSPPNSPPTVPSTIPAQAARASPITLGLVVHSLADGLALGASSISTSDVASRPNPLSLIVFFALMIHKAPTALALSSSLLALQLSRARVRMHLIVFSLATPIGAILSYLALDIWGSGEQAGEWSGIALAFSGGTFLYVATVLQPVRREEAQQSHDHSQPLLPSQTQDQEPKRISDLQRVFLIMFGMFTPFGLSAIFGHGHD